MQQPAMLLQRRHQTPPPFAIRFIANEETTTLETLADGDRFPPRGSTNVEHRTAREHAQSSSRENRREVQGIVKSAACTVDRWGRKLRV
jgi:hypothetical protein